MTEAFNKIAPITSSHPRNLDHLIINHQPHISELASVFESKISLEEYKNAVNSFKPNTAPGPDLISFKVIQRLPISIHKKVLDFFNNILKSCIIPESWRNYFVIFIPKPNKTDVRPISLAQSFCKIFEKIIQRKLEWWVKRNDKIPNFKSGFRRGRSCIDSVATLTADISKNMSSNDMTGVVFLDIKGAYDNVDPLLLHKELWRIGIPCNILKIIWNMTKIRFITAYGNDENLGSRHTTSGLPQGSVLSPILFNLYLSRIMLSISDNTIKIVQYADDIALYYSSKELKDICSKLNKALDEVDCFVYAIKD